MYQWYLHWYHWKEECLLFHFIIVKNPSRNYPGFVLQAKSAIFTAKCPARASFIKEVELVHRCASVPHQSEMWEWS